VNLTLNVSNAILQGSYCRFGENIVQPDYIEPGMISCRGVSLHPGIVNVSASYDGTIWSEKPVSVVVIGNE
jgi:hypothetical protein